MKAPVWQFSCERGRGCHCRPAALELALVRRILALLLAAACALAVSGLAASVTTAPKLGVKPATVLPGGKITITGSHFRPRVRVTIDIGPRNSDNTSRLGTIKANAGGGFRLSKAISKSTRLGRYVVLACQATCRVKATAPLAVTKVKPI
jgi:hypothetical protein